MDSHLYVDQYLRRKKGASFPSASPQQQQLSHAAHNAILAAANLRHSAATSNDQVAANTRAATVESRSVERALGEHADVVKDLAVHVQAFVDRTDNLNLQVQTVEDKLLNLTKLLKVAQDIADEQCQSLAEQVTEVRKSIDSILDAEGRTKSEISELRSLVPQIVREAVAAAKSDMRVEIDAVKATVQQLEKQQIVMRSDLLSGFSASAENIVVARIHQESERHANALRELQAKFTADINNVERDFSARLTDRKSFFESEMRNRRGSDDVSIETIRRIVEERLSATQSQARELHQLELRQALLSAQSATRDDYTKAIQHLEDEVRDLASRVKTVEEHNVTIEGSFHEFIGAFKEHTAHQAARMEETSVSMKELMELHDETRSVVAAELETTKQWATRNMTRLKKHIDNTNVDIGAVKDAHRDLHHLVERLRSSQVDERSKLADLVEQRTREAAALSDMVDREISSVQNIARTYRTSARGRSADAVRAAATRPQSESTGVAYRPNEAAEEEEDEDDDVFGKFAERTTARRQQMRALFAELKSDAPKAA
jgi:hypothetical protein